MHEGSRMNALAIIPVRGGSKLRPRKTSARTRELLMMEARDIHNDEDRDSAGLKYLCRHAATP